MSPTVLFSYFSNAYMEVKKKSNLLVEYTINSSHQIFLYFSRYDLTAGKIGEEVKSNPTTTNSNNVTDDVTANTISSEFPFYLFLSFVKRNFEDEFVFFQNDFLHPMLMISIFISLEFTKYTPKNST